MDGFLNIAKPPGCTSRDVVNRVLRRVRPDKVGHAGTLDPLACGVLVVAVGQGTRLVEYVQQTVKVYRARFLLGHQSDTEDLEAEVRPLPDAPQASIQELSAACERFVGEFEQTPPQYSALKVSGKRAYELARRGKTADLAPRKVRLDACRLVHYAYPEFELHIECGSGFYVRSLGRDIGQSLGSNAVMSQLTRTRVGAFSLEDAVTLERLEEDSIEDHLQPLATAVSHLRSCRLTQDEIAVLSQGGFIEDRFGLSERVDRSEVFAGLDDENRLAVLLRSKRTGELRPVKNLTRTSTNGDV